MGRVTANASVHVGANLDPAKMRSYHSFCLGAIASDRVKSSLQHKNVDAWRLEGADKYTVNYSCRKIIRSTLKCAT